MTVLHVVPLVTVVMTVTGVVGSGGGHGMGFPLSSLQGGGLLEHVGGVSVVVMVVVSVHGIEFPSRSVQPPKVVTVVATGEGQVTGSLGVLVGGGLGGKPQTIELPLLSVHGNDGTTVTVTVDTGVHFVIETGGPVTVTVVSGVQGDGLPLSSVH